MVDPTDGNPVQEYGIVVSLEWIAIATSIFGSLVTVRLSGPIQRRSPQCEVALRTSSPHTPVALISRSKARAVRSLMGGDG